MISENTVQRNAMRNSIAEITRKISDTDISVCLEHGLAFKRTPDAEEVKEYHAKLKEIAQDLYKHNIDNMMDGNASSTQPGIKLIKKYVWELAEEIQALLEGVSGKSSLKPLIKYCEILPTKKCTFESRCQELALIALTHVVNGVTATSTTKTSDSGLAKSRTVKEIGKVISRKIFDDAVAQENRLAYENKMERLKDAKIRTYKPSSRKQLMVNVWGVKKRGHEALESLEQERFDKAKTDMGIRFGGQLVNTLVEKFDFVEVKKRISPNNKKHSFNNLELNQEHAAEVQEMISQGASQVSLEMPSISLPRQWESPKRFGKSLVRNSNYKTYKEGEIVDHVAKIDKDLHSRQNMERVYKVLDIIEATEWTVDAEMIAVLNQCIQEGVEVPGINSVAIVPPKPPSKWAFRNEAKEDEEITFDMVEFEQACKEYREANPTAFEDATDEELIKKWHKSYKAKASNDSKCAAGIRSIETASALQEFEKIYFPHNMDTRGRIYPIATSLNPQLNDVSKGLLKFAEGDIVDEEALGWLEVNIANNWANEVEIELTDEELMNEIEFIRQFV